MRFSVRQMLVGIVIVSILLALLTVFAVRPASDAIEREENLHIFFGSLELVNEYLEQEREWPRSWDDLDKLPAGERGSFHWPEDKELVKQKVFIDFEADLEELRQRSPKEFDAIRPTGKCWSYWDYYEVFGLPQTIQTIVEERKAGITEGASQ